MDPQAQGQGEASAQAQEQLTVGAGPRRLLELRDVRSATTAAAMSIECTTSANKTVTCLYSAEVAGGRDWRAAFVAEP